MKRQLTITALIFLAAIVCHINTSKAADGFTGVNKGKHRYKAIPYGYSTERLQKELKRYKAPVRAASVPTEMEHQVVQTSYALSEDPGDGDSLPESIGEELPEALVNQAWNSAAAGAEGYDLFAMRRPFLGRFWFRGQYLHWWARGNHVVPLVTTSPNNTPPDEAGVLGLSTTTTLYGGNRVNSETLSGMRFALGYRLDPCGNFSIEANFLGLGQSSSKFSANSDTFGVIARPYYNIVLGEQDANRVAYPGELTGRIDAEVTSEFNSFELLVRQQVLRRCNLTLDFQYGWRTVQLDDGLLIRDQSFAESTNTTINSFDLFDSYNEFHGVELGITSVYAPVCYRWSFEMIMKLSLGSTSSKVLIDGQAVSSSGSPGVPTEGGLLALPTNMGTYRRSDFSFVPEIGLNARFDVTPNARLTLGYSLIAWNGVARAPNQIDFDVNPSQLPPGPLIGAPRPRFAWDRTDYWAQGLNFGLDVRY